MNRRTKIVCTIGPASRDTDVLVRLVEAGMNVARLNFSHGEPAEHAAVLVNLREAERRTGVEIAALQDLQGPKIRVGTFRGGAAELRAGAAFVLTGTPVPEGDAARVAITYPALAREVHPGSPLLLDDGAIALRVTRVEGPDIVTEVETGGVLRDHKGIVAPGAQLSAETISDKDRADLAFGIAHGVDAVALSFVRSEGDVLALREDMRRLGRVVPIVAKIERVEGIEDIADISRDADAVMVARGDLGLEMDAAEVPFFQKEIVRRCNAIGRPVIIATQMLESMIAHPRPTRAEASDVANAVLDGADAVMLSGETGVGAYPVEAVRTMAHIVRKTEERFPPVSHARAEVGDAGDAIGRACCRLAEQVNAAAIVALTATGGTARLIAKHRPRMPVLALSDRADARRGLAFSWGVTARPFPVLTGDALPQDAVREAVRGSGIAPDGGLLVVAAGVPLGSGVPTNSISLVEL